MKQYAKGYTIYELIVVITIIAILATRAFPIIYTQLIKHNLETTSLQLQSVLKYAQEEAVRRSSTVIRLCPASYNVNQILTGENCSGNDGLWSNGILLFADFNNDANYVSGERIQAGRFDHGVTVTITLGGANINSLTINSSGQIEQIPSNSQAAIEFRLAKYGKCLYSSYNLNTYGVMTPVNLNENCL